jgi:hypothetical protein
MNAQKILVTKDQAQKWLEKNHSNRNISRNHVGFLRRQMDDGLWQYAADPIRFSGNYERLIDGQHRLTAFIESSLNEIYFLVVIDLKEEAFDVLDTGRNRNAKDLLFINNYEHAGRAAAIIKAIKTIKEGNVVSKVKGGGGNRYAKTMTNHEVLEFAEKNSALPAIVKQAENWYARFPALKPAEYGAFYFVFIEKSPEQAYDFFQDLSSGLNLTEENPIYLLRKKLEIDKLSSTRMVGKMRHYLIVSAWNLFRQGKTAKRLSYRPGDELPEII